MRRPAVVLSVSFLFGLFLRTLVVIPWVSCPIMRAIPVDVNDAMPLVRSEEPAYMYIGPHRPKQNGEGSSRHTYA